MTFQLQYWMEGKWFAGRLRQHHQVFTKSRTLNGLRHNIADQYRLIHEPPKTLDLKALTMRQLKRKPR